MTRFGDFEPLCSSVPSYPRCNLFYCQLVRISTFAVLHDASASLHWPALASTRNASLHLHSTHCSPHRIWATSQMTSHPPSPSSSPWPSSGSLTDVRLPWAASNSDPSSPSTPSLCSSMQSLLAHSFKAAQPSSFSQPCTPASSFFWGLLVNAIVATQFVKDGTWSNLVPYHIFSFLVFALGTYLALDSRRSAPQRLPTALRSISLFVVFSI
ncbi:hypothetical protein H2248_011903 [Termitomyces sp. 'cryptogamus']|nr:hypothetical protein H2248_011903 [Termitomyces sp. 'cryptogamus']